jgi:hypothetical protein
MMVFIFKWQYFSFIGKIFGMLFNFKCYTGTSAFFLTNLIPQNVRQGDVVLEEHYNL